jgi:flagellar hook-associated protein 2
VTLNVATDTQALIGKVNSFVSTFNTVVGSVNKLAGIGSTPAAVKGLSGDSTLRSILQDIRSSVANSGPGQTGGLYNAFRDVGVTIQKDGTLAVDNEKLTKAITSDAASVQKLFARPIGATSGGVMASVRDTVEGITNFTSGKLTARRKLFDERAKKADEEAQKKTDAVDAYATRLRKSFTAMDDAYAKNQNLGAALSRMG